MSTPFKMTGWSGYQNSPLEQKEKHVTTELEGNPDVGYRKVVKTNKKGATTTTISGDALSDREYIYPMSAQGPYGPYKHIERQPYMYKGKEDDVSIWRRRFKSKTNESGDIIKQKEKVIYDDGNQMKKVKQRKVKFGKNKGKIKTVTTHMNRGEKTKTKTYSDKVDTSPILRKKKQYGV